MAFFTSPEQELYEHRLKRSSSNASLRTRSRRPSDAAKSTAAPRIDTRTQTMFPTQSSASAHDVSPVRRNPSVIPSPVPRSMQPGLARVALQNAGPSSKLPPESPQRGHSPHASHRPGDAPRTPLGQPSPNAPDFGQRQPYAGMLSSAAVASRSKTGLYSGSLSDSGISPRPPRSPRRLNTALPYQTHLSPLDARHPSPSSPNLSLAGYRSDGASFERSPSPLPASRLDVKRLLSKPAAPSVSSTLSITSDSESPTGPRTRVDSNEAWPSKSRLQQPQTPVKSPRPSILSSGGSHEQSPASSSQPRQRNLLRKKSASGQNRAAVSATLPSKTSTSSPTQTAIRSSAAPSRSQRPTTLQSVLDSRAPAPSPVPSSGSGKLTPAGAIAQAYKEQDIRRESLAATARAEDPPDSALLGAPRIDTFGRRASQQSTNSALEEGTPYYTVFGSTSGRLVAVGSAEDSSLYSMPMDYDWRAPAAAPPAAPAAPNQPVKTLSRKVSARFRRIASVSETGHGDPEGTPRKSSGRASEHHRRRSTSLTKPKRKPESLRISVDEAVAPFASAGAGDSPGPHSSQPLSSKSTPESTGSWTHVPAKGKEKDEDTGAGGRLWRLVKRISSGGLRDRYYVPDTPPPPVPAIPKDLLPQPRATFEMQRPAPPSAPARSIGAGGRGATDRFMDSRGSMSAVRGDARLARRPSTATGVPTRAARPPPSPNTASAAATARRPSTSSSPQSEPASTRFFRSHSSRSSMSSFAGADPPPPMPAPAPRARAQSSSSSSPPARRRSLSHDAAESARARKRGSPDIPAFSVADVVNNFIARRPSLTGRHQPPPSSSSLARPRRDDGVAVVVTAPPRPARSERRNTMHAAALALAPPAQSGRDSASLSSGSTERGGGDGAGGSASVAQLTFRELGKGRRQAWTSQEKEDKWDDLLERSALAGGTLHLGADGARLASDNIRFSTSTLASGVSS